MKFHHVLMVAVFGIIVCFNYPSIAKVKEYSLTINREKVDIGKKNLERVTINGTTPGPVLRFTEGDTAVVHVKNNMKQDTSIHWHGLLLDPAMDGVPGLSGFEGIKPGKSFTYKFKIRQNGTYWYHSHSGGQEQEGHYGAIVIKPKKDVFKTDRDYVVVLSDSSEETPDTIYSNLKMSSDYYQYARRTVGDFFTDVKERGFSKAWKNAKMWNEMRMLPTDLADVSGYTFLVNGETPDENWTGIFKSGEKVRLRFINAAAMSFFDVRIPGLKMKVIATDGQYVEPVWVDEFRMGVAETYDVIVTPKESKAYTIAAEPLSRAGFAIGTLAPNKGMKGEVPKQRKPALLTMADMGGSHSGHSMHGHHEAKDYKTGKKGSGWAKTRMPKGNKALEYKDLRYFYKQEDVRKPEREIVIKLGGNMERYIWTMDDKKYADAEPVKLNYGERAKLTFVNETMMAHPMHLHGMFVQLENGQPMSKLPNKHTIIVAPGDSYSVLITADEVGEWAFHCHLIYHMMAGMMNKVVVAKLDPSQMPVKAKAKAKMNNHNMHNMHKKHNMHKVKKSHGGHDHAQ